MSNQRKRKDIPRKRGGIQVMQRFINLITSTRETKLRAAICIRAVLRGGYLQARLERPKPGLLGDLTTTYPEPNGKKNHER